MTRHPGVGIPEGLSLSARLTTSLGLLHEDEEQSASHHITRLVSEYLERTHLGRGKAFAPLSSQELTLLFHEEMPLTGRPFEEVVARIAEQVIPNCYHANHPRALGHQLAAPLPAAIWLTSLVAALNQGMPVWDLSPAVTTIERRVLRWFAHLAGFPAEAEGILTFGATEANLTALLAARSRIAPDAWRDGVPDKLVLISGANAHYSIERAAGIMGLGVNKLVTVQSRSFAMDPDALDACLTRLRREGRKVVAVVATAGSTATGSFDPLDRIADVCERHAVWLHVDAAHGGSALLSSSHAYRLAGIARADSFAMDPHKMMLFPLNVGMLVVREPRALERAFQQSAPYLFDGAPGDDRHSDGALSEGSADELRPDQGPRSLMTSRRGDALIVWGCLHRYGQSHFATIYDHLCELTTYLHEKLDEEGCYELPHEPEANMLCFRHQVHAELSAATVNRAIRQHVLDEGEAWISSTTLENEYMLRVSINNPYTNRADIDALVAALARAYHRRDVANARSSEIHGIMPC